MHEIQRVWEENHEVYDARKVWRQLDREGFKIAHCTTERLMKTMVLQGATRNRTIKHTTIPSKSNLRPLDLVQRAFWADRPNQLWVANFTIAIVEANIFLFATLIDLPKKESRRP